MKEKIFYSIFALVVVAGAVFLGSEGVFVSGQESDGLNASLFGNIFGKGSYFNEDSVYSCRADKDCMAIQKGCCNCANGGYTIAINKAFKNYWTRTYLTKCEGVRCPAVYHYCSWTAGCENKRCVLK